MLDEVDSVKDLGIILDRKLSSDTHIEKIVHGSLKLLGFVKRTAKNFKRTDTLTILLNTFVRPRLEIPQVRFGTLPIT